MKIAIIGNYPPRKCGIATFTENFVRSLDGLDISGLEMEVFAMNDNEEGYPYPDLVKMSIRQNEMQDYDKAIKYINENNFDYCHIQHEYGIFGGVSGIYVMQFLARIEIPIALTLHTVLKEPDFYQRQILYAMGLVSNRIFVMSQLAVRFLKHIYKIPSEKISVIEHGTPVFPSFNKEKAKEVMGWEDRVSILTFGLLGRSKGIEVAIRALPEVIKKNPKVIYTVLGKTHPHVVNHEGETYRESLHKLAKDLGVLHHVEFVDEYANEEMLLKYLGAADIYITPYLNENQITSGTLCYAVASGAAVISTPYWHATELLDQNRGLLFPFHESEILKEHLLRLSNDAGYLKKYQIAAYEYGKTIEWPKIGEDYYKSALEIVKESKLKDLNINNILLAFQPDLSLDHLHRLTDDLGLLQHARYIFPNYQHGYCTDDNARALLFATMHYQLKKDKTILLLIDKYLSFLSFTLNEDGSFVNFLDYSRNKLEANGSDDSFGRAVWALGYLVAHAPNQMYREYATEMFLSSWKNFHSINSIRGMANVMIGISHFLTIHHDHQELRKKLHQFAVDMFNAYVSENTKEWKWFEGVLSYDNGVLPLAMLSAAKVLKNSIFLETGLESLRFLESITLPDNRLSLVGNEEWLKKGGKKSQFSQQAIDAMAMSLSYKKAYEITNEKHYFKKLEYCYTWFLGNNDVFVPLYDEETKGCCDGLHRYGVNRNQGAESLLSWLISAVAYAQVQ